MNFKKIVLLVVILSMIISSFSSVFANSKVEKIKEEYSRLNFKGEKPSFEAFHKAMMGYSNLEKSQKLKNKKYLTLIDFSLSANKERLWIIDMEKLEVVHHTYVSHGRNTGDEYAAKFSNTPNSYMSSLGFYVTGDTYIGKHGYSLYLDGMDKGFNDNARKRAIVMHSADYATPEFVKKVGRLGRSFGCPAIPPHLHKEIINMIKGGSLMFIYYPDTNYLKKSTLLV